MEAGPGTGTGAGAEVEMRPLQHHSTAMSHQLHDYVADGDYDACIDGGSDGGSPSRASKARDGRGRRRRCWPRLAHLFLHLSHSARQAGTRYRAGLRLLPRVPLALLCVCWGVYLALQVARSLSRACSPQYWALFGVQVVLMVGCGVFAAWLLRHLVRRARARARALARRADEADAMEAGTA